MWPVIVDLVAAVVAGGLVTLLVRRWPHAPVTAPQVEPSTIHARCAVMVGWRRCCGLASTRRRRRASR